MELTICERFPSLTPMSLRRERASEVFKMISKLIDHQRRENAKWITINGKRMRKKKATSDTWF